MNYQDVTNTNESTFRAFAAGELELARINSVPVWTHSWQRFVPFRWIFRPDHYLVSYEFEHGATITMTDEEFAKFKEKR